MQWYNQIISYDAAKLENVVKIYVPIWFNFAGPVTFSSDYVLVLFYAPVRVRGVLGDGSPSEITLYIPRNNCTKFGAFVRFVPILLLTDITNTMCIYFIALLWIRMMLLRVLAQRWEKAIIAKYAANHRIIMDSPVVLLLNCLGTHDNRGQKNC